jgi:conjugal transfer ATP-binding protein TraC
MKQLFKRILAGRDAGATHAEYRDLLDRTKFSDYLLWDYCEQPDPAKHEYTYYNTDGSFGCMIECIPNVYTSEKTLQISEQLLRLAVPHMSVLQLLSHADDNIKPDLEAYRALRAGADNPRIHADVENHCAFLQACTKGIDQMSGIPLRNGRLIISLRIPPTTKKVNFKAIRSNLRKALDGMDLTYPDMPEMSPGQFLEWSSRLLNDSVPEMKQPNGVSLAGHYDYRRTLSKQIISKETPIDVTDDYIKIGSRYWVCMSPHKYATEVDPAKTKQLGGGLWGLKTEDEQHKVPFLRVMNIIYDHNVKGYVQRKGELVLAQGGSGTFRRKLNKIKDEHSWAVDKIDEGGRFARVMEFIWFIGDSYDQADDALKHGKSLYERHGFEMQEDKFILAANLLASFPLGLRATPQNLAIHERDWIADPEAICNILPIQGEFKGSREAVSIFPSRNGQLTKLSIYSKAAKNYNGFIAAPPGSGKSVLMNKLIDDHHSTGAHIAIVDVGGSYERLCEEKEGRYIDFAPGDCFCLNPFTYVALVDKDLTGVELAEAIDRRDEDLKGIGVICMQMAYSYSDAPIISENEYTLMDEAVEWAYEFKQNDASVEEVYNYLVEYPKYINPDKRHTPDIVEKAHHLAYNIYKFAFGPYRKYFVGKSDLNIQTDHFVVLELQRLSTKKDLFRVITLVVLDAVTRNLYSSDRSIQKMAFFDESWQFLEDNSDNPLMAKGVGAGYRKGRKHRGAFWVATQSVMDRKLFGKLGDVIWTFSDYKCLLESGDYAKAAKEGLIPYDDFTVELLESLKRSGTDFSEVYIETPYGCGIIRVLLDAHSYYRFTTEGGEVSEIKALRASGMSNTDAINAMVRKYRPWAVNA